MFYLLIATTPVPIGGRQAVMLNHPSGNKADVVQFVRQMSLTTKGVKYKIEGPLLTNDPNPLVLVTQLMMPPQVSAEAVAAAMNSPHGQQGQNRPNGQPDGMGFAPLGDEALPVDGDGNMFGDVNDGTVTDIVQDGGLQREVVRPVFRE